MRITFTSLLLAAAISAPAYGLEDLTAFPLLQNECAQIGGISFGADSRWASCRVTKGRWFATVDFIDFYQAQYCLGGEGDQCEHTAQMIFSNRAYTPVGRLVAQRSDPAGTRYDDPVVYVGDFGRIMVLSGHAPDGSVSQKYFSWDGRSWLPSEPQAWLNEPPYRLSSRAVTGFYAMPDVGLDGAEMPARAQAQVAISSEISGSK